MEGSEQELPWDRSSTSRGPNAGLEASNASLGLAGIRALSHKQAPAEEEEIDAAFGAQRAAVDEDAGEISLREWLDKPERTVDQLECLHIFRQVVEMVTLAHSQGVVVTNVRPSCFVMSPLNRLSFIESASCSLSGSQHLDDGSGSDAKDGGSQHSSPSGNAPEGTNDNAFYSGCLLPSSAIAVHSSQMGNKDEGDIEESKREVDENKVLPLKRKLLVELNWYTSPEEAAGDPGTFASDIYRLGVLLFELFCTFDSLDEKLGTMANLRHRVLPPQLLLKWPKQASFCLWLLHPQPNTRPKMSEVVDSEFLSEARNRLEECEAASRLQEEIEDQELLLEFLLLMQRRTQEAADKLHSTIESISVDIEEVLNRKSVIGKDGDSCSELHKDENSTTKKVDQTFVCPVVSTDSGSLGRRKRFRPGFQRYSVEEHNENLVGDSRLEAQAELQESKLSRSSRLMKNFRKLESAYFSARFKVTKQEGKLTNRKFAVPNSGGRPTSQNDGTSVYGLASMEGHHQGRNDVWIDTFLDGLCKYLSFSKLNVRADLKRGDLLNSASLVCSLSFDRDNELFATAGVNKRIKIFDCNMILDGDRDIHYPIAEMVGRSKFSSICWNNYIKSHLASSDFEGVVQVWDATRGQVFVEMSEHERRVWSVDFSMADPTKLASGSDDGAVKLWNINQAGSVGTIQTKANVCSVQFPPHSSLSLAIGSADHNVYCYDLRNFRTPYFTLVGHTKTVSYVKFMDSTTIVSASTDSSLKLWDLSLCTSRVLDDPIQTFTGHTNVKNFVGLSLSDGYIATGSETNEVFVYHKAFPMPVLSYKFTCTDPISGCEVDDTMQFISCVCWRGQTSTLLAANSCGNIRLLEMA